ncbi:MAG: hypothetical protein KatS3mg111_0386 [Pirellulaceae bacterium]|nr:MAG: hypothetical protein KatS3mg111_0386 [Pirellulaceae bacterium]
MGKLSDILSGSGTDDIRNLWDASDEAEDYGPLPPGEYVAHVASGELFTSRTNHTPGYKLTFRLIEGEYAGRLVWHDLWLTPAAIPLTKRDLGKLGVTSLEQLERPIPLGIRCRVKVVLRRDDDGTEYNRVRRFDVLGIDKPESDPFAPTDTADDAADGGTANTSGESAADDGTGDAADV